MKIEISSDLLEEIAAEELKRTLELLEADYKARKAGKGIAIFSLKKDEDLAELKKHIEAFKLVGRYYGVKL
jgi:hypothetical protein